MKTKFAFHIAQFLLVVCTTLYIPHSVAGGVVKGPVELLRVHDAVRNPSWKPPRFWFALRGISSAGSCPKWGEKLLFAANEDSMLDLILTAMKANLEVAVGYDDTSLTTGQCTASFITLGVVLKCIG